MIEIETIVTLRCDACQGTFLYAADFAGQETNATGAEREREALEAAVFVERTIDQLRDLAERSDWCHLLPIRTGQPPRDLCPSCYTLPPEA